MDTAKLPERTYRPKWDGNDIVAGSKRLAVNGNSSIALTENGETLMTMGYSCRAKSRATGKTYYPGPCYHYLEGGGTVTREGNAIVHRRPYRLEEYEWRDAFYQRVEILPDGLVRVEVRWTDPDVDTFEFGSIGASWSIPYAAVQGQRVAVNGATAPFPEQPGNEGMSWKAGADGRVAFDFFRGHASRQFGIFADAKGSGAAGELFRLPKGLNYRILERREGKVHGYVIYIDIRKGADAVESPDKRGGIDFRKVENLSMPVTGTRNMVLNPSFEAGLKGLGQAGDTGSGFYPQKWDLEVWKADTNEHVHGSKSLRILTWNRDGTNYRNLETTGGIVLQPFVAEPGEYVLSFFAKGDVPGKQMFSAWIANFSTGSAYAPIPGGVVTVWPTEEWTRHELKVRIPVSMPVLIHLSAAYRPDPKAGDPRIGWSNVHGCINNYDLAKAKDKPHGAVWVDAFQFERGTEMTEFAPPPAEAELVTSAPDDYVSDGSPIDARLIVSAAPGAKGAASVRVRDFFGRERFRKAFRFVADADGHAVIAPDFDGAKLGRGLFVVETEYALADGTRAREFDRFAIVDYLRNEHPRRFLCSDDYGTPGEHENVRHRLDRWRKAGFGMKAHVATYHKECYDLYREYGIPFVDTIAPTRYYDTNGVRRWCYQLVRSRTNDRDAASQPNVLFKDPVMDEDCPENVPTEKYLAKVRRSAATLARTYPWVERWQFGGEFFSAYPLEYWSPDGKPEHAYMNFAKILKAFGEGIREVCPEKPYAGDNPWNMNADSGIPEIEGILAASEKIGLRFDRLTCHSYRARPESPDMDADLTRLMAVYRKFGYEGTPFDLPEGMHWGPYEIPPWGTISGSWGAAPVTWHGEGAISYDLGWTEKVSAAWYCRSWIIALKHNVHSACAGMAVNNFTVEYDRLTPRAAQMMPNVIGHQLGWAKGLVADVRFAPYMRAYVFDDGFGRPVAALWCCDPEVDAGRKAPPVVSTDFGGTLERVTDVMNNACAFPAKGPFTYQMSPFPVFLRGRKGSEKAFVEALEATKVVSGGIAEPAALSASVKDEKTLALFVSNLLNSRLEGRLNGKTVEVEALRSATFESPLERPLGFDAVRKLSVPISFEPTDGKPMSRTVVFGALAVKEVNAAGDPRRVAWEGIPKIALEPWGTVPKGYGGTAQFAWSSGYLYLRVAVKDAKFVATKFSAEQDRNWNDTLQLCFDPRGDARRREADEPAEDDYEYAFFPEPDGKGLVSWAHRVADRQITGNDREHGNCRIPGLNVAFERTEDGYVYSICLPRARINPGWITRNSVLSTGLVVYNADDPTLPPGRARVSGGLSLGRGDVVGHPQGWTELLFVEK